MRAAAIVRTEQRDIRVDIYGAVSSGNERYYEGLLALRAELGLDETVRFMGPTNDVAGAYASGHVALVTSLSEGFPGRRGRGDDERAPRGGYRSRARARDTR